MSRMTVTMRPGQAQDYPAILALYNYYVAKTPITFDIEPCTLELRQPWFAQFREESPHQLWVAAQGSTVVGYAASQPFRAKAAYGRTVETSLYLNQDSTGQGIGTVLYNVLLNALEPAGVHRAIAGITLPNERSVALHKRFGFHHVGTMTQVGFKFDRYWDVAWYERPV